MKKEALLEAPEQIEAQPIPGEIYASAIEAYLSDGEKSNALRPHQKEVFSDFSGFFLSGARKGYMTSPTGTGKTVVFVELSKAVNEVEKLIGRKPKVLVVEPTKDLVHQTMGRKGKKGYGRFAKDLKVSSFFSDSTEEDKRTLHTADVVVTTYDSFPAMSRRKEVRDQTDEEKEAYLRAAMDKILGSASSMSRNLGYQIESLDTIIRKELGTVATGKTLLSMFDLFILDEAHYILGDNTYSKEVDALDDDVVVLGFTATPDANEKRRLDEHLPIKIHDLTFAEAEAMELLAPVASIAVNSDARIQGTDLFSKEGEYLEESLNYLAGDTRRNELIIGITKLLVEHGFPSVVPCLPGNGSLHARIIADRLNLNGINAAAIHSDIPTSERNKIYESFEAGELAALTNTRILGVGWDSQRAKGMVYAGPTRSPIQKRQHVGRVLRPGDLAVVVEIKDHYDALNPPLTMADIISGEDIKNGDIFGVYNKDDQKRVESLMTAIGEMATLPATVPADYSRLFDTLAEYQQIVNGRVRTFRTGHFAVPETMSPLYAGLTDEIATRLWRDRGAEPDVELGRQNFNIRMLYNVGETLQLIRELPVSDSAKAYVENGERWLSPKGFVIGFNKEFPGLEEHEIEERLRELGDNVDWRPLRDPVAKQHQAQQLEYRIYKAYRADSELIGTLRQQLVDYYSILDSLKAHK